MRTPNPPIVERNRLGPCVAALVAAAILAATARAADDPAPRFGSPSQAFGSTHLPDGGVGRPLGQGLLIAGDELSLEERLGFDWRGRLSFTGGSVAMAPIWRGQNWSIGPRYSLDWSRPDGDGTAAGLLGIVPTLEAGLRAEWAFGPLRFDGGLRQGIGGGAVGADVGVAYVRGLSESTGLTIGGGVNWGHDSSAIGGTEGAFPGGFSRFSSEPGRGDIGGNVSLFYRPGRQWFGALNMEVDRALNEVGTADPAVAESQLFFGLIIGFSF